MRFDSKKQMAIDLFCVGINQPIDPLSNEMHRSAPALQYAASDAENFCTQVTKQYSVRSTVLLHDGPTCRVVPTRINILGQLKKKCDMETDEGMLLFYFAGHGVEVEGRFAICPRDYAPFVPEYSALTLESVLDATKGYPGYRIFIFDCCRQAALGADQPTPRDGRMPDCKYSMAPGSTVFLSCRAGQVSWETDYFHNESGFGGLFTHFLIESIKKTAAKKVRVLDLFDKAKIGVSSHSTDRGLQAQAPEYYGSNIGDYYFMKA